MKSKPYMRTIRTLLASAAIAVATQVMADTPVDNFSNPTLTSLGYPRLMVDDASMGGKSSYKADYSSGHLKMEGSLRPARGQPGFISMVLLLSPDGSPQDKSHYEGIKLTICVKKGMVSVLAASSEITNFDFHASPISRNGKELKEVKIPFASMKRVWSEQTPLDTANLTSINLVASNLQPGDFAYEVAEVTFY
jgi:hypothetical protein